MPYAHVTAGSVDSIGTPPRLVFLNGRWYDLRTLDPATLAIAGWYPIQEAARPAETATTTYAASYALSGNTVVQTWTGSPKTAAQLASDTANANRSTLETQLNSDLATLQGIIDTANGAFTLNQLAAAVKDMARVQRRQIRLQVEKLDGTT